MLKHEKPNNTVPNQEELDRMYAEMLKPVELSDDELELVNGAWGRWWGGRWGRWGGWWGGYGGYGGYGCGCC
jgi:hypothetical protein